MPGAIAPPMNSPFAEMMRRDDALPLPPEPDPVPWSDRLRGALARVLARFGHRPEGAGA